MCFLNTNNWTGMRSIAGNQEGSCCMKITEKKQHHTATINIKYCGYKIMWYCNWAWMLYIKERKLTLIKISSAILTQALIIIIFFFFFYRSIEGAAVMMVIRFVFYVLVKRCWQKNGSCILFYFITFDQYFF